MIARIFIWIILLIVLPDFYLDRYYLKDRRNISVKKRILWWMPAFALLIYTVALATNKNFVPDNIFWLRLYLFLVGLFIVPKAAFSFFSLIGLIVCRVRHKHRNVGNAIGAVCAVITLIMFFYGLLYGWRRFEIKHVDIYVDNLPKSFDGYRITHFSDAHLGSFMGSAESVLRRDIDSINAQHSDMIVFTGDLQNIKPTELYPFKPLMSVLHARDGVFSVLGNHDYGDYVSVDSLAKKANERETQRMERSFGWHLLMNENAVIKRGRDSIFIAGEENDDEKKHDYYDKNKTYQGIPMNAFVICLQHNPLFWDYSLIPEKSRAVARITLCGHTHAGQISLFGLRPTMAHYKYDYGLYEKNGYFINVTGGIGGLVPFRLGSTPEINVITLHRKP
nr:metallophosphoesterase family protein [Prevotella sp.]